MKGTAPSLEQGASLVAAGAFGVVFAVLVVCQGGYYGSAACACGCAVGVVLVALAAVRAVSARRQGRGANAGAYAPASWGALLVPALLLLLAIAYVISAFANGASYTSVIEAASWFAVVGVAFLCAHLDARAARVAVAAVCWIGIVCGAAGFLAFSGILPLPGAVFSGRLQFTFQYANAAGIFFASTAVLCLVAGGASARRFASLPMAATFLTQSAGSLVVLVVAVASAAAWFARTRQADRLAAVGAQAAVAVVAATCCLFADADAVYAVACLVLAAYGWAAGREEWLTPRAIVTLPVLAVAVIAVGAYFAVSGRAFEASQTFVERFIQVYDAAGLVAASPLLGVGPDAWQWLYPYEQSAQYQVSVVHCSYAQVAADAGVVGLALLLAAAVVGFVRLARERSWGALIVAGMIAVHSLVDFDLQFAALAALFAFLLVAPGGEGGESGDRGEAPPRAGIAPALVCGAVGVAVIVACAAGVALDRERAVFSVYSAESGQSEPASYAADVVSARVIAAFEGNALAERDVDAQASYLVALCDAGRPEAAVAYAEERGVRSADQAFAVAYAWRAQDDDVRAAETLIAELEREPFNLYLFQEVARFFADNGVPAECADRYEAAVAAANRLAREWPASLLANQENVKTPEDVQ